MRRLVGNVVLIGLWLFMVSRFWTVFHLKEMPVYKDSPDYNWQYLVGNTFHFKEEYWERMSWTAPNHPASYRVVHKDNQTKGLTIYFTGSGCYVTKDQ
jgi:hypothetical protein